MRPLAAPLIGALGLVACSKAESDASPPVLTLPSATPSALPVVASIPFRVEPLGTVAAPTPLPRRLLKKVSTYVDALGITRRFPADVKLILAGDHPDLRPSELDRPKLQFFDLECDKSSNAMRDFFLAGGAPPERLSVCVVPLESPDLDLGACVGKCSLVWSEGTLNAIQPGDRPVVRVDAETWKMLETSTLGPRVCLKGGFAGACD